MTPTQQKIIISYPTYEKFMDNFKPAQLLVTYANITTISRSVAVRVPRLMLEDINDTYSSPKMNAGVSYVKSWLDFLNKFSNLNKQLTETESVAFMIYTGHKRFYLTDMKIIFEKIMRCEYGIFYGSVDAPRILGAFTQYAMERESTLKSINENCTRQVQEFMDPMYKAATLRINPKIAEIMDEDEKLKEKQRLWAIENIRLDKIRDDFAEETLKKIQ